MLHSDQEWHLPGSRGPRTLPASRGGSQIQSAPVGPLGGAAQPTSACTLTRDTERNFGLSPFRIPDS